jgi:hypothetical protein
MSRTRLLLLTVALLVGLTPLIASPGTAGAAQNPNKPVVEEVDDTFLAPNLTNRCGFEVWAHVHGTLTVKAHPSGADRVQFRYTHTFSGPGGSVSVNRVENARITLTVLPDGTEVDHITATGTLMYHMVIPGYGSIANNSGREVFEITWRWDEDLQDWIEVDYQLYFDSGPNNELSDAEYAVICEHLA